MIKAAEGKDRSYITAVQEELQQYTQGLLRENEKLRAMSTTLESDKRRLELEVIEARVVLQQKDELRRAAEAFEVERMETRMQLDRARHDCDAATLELERLRARFHGNGRVALILDIQEVIRRAAESAAANRRSES
ncbi:MAG: hypothetical protein WB973_05200 [Thermoanaerobaculia bacterium]